VMRVRIIHGPRGMSNNCNINFFTGAV
jgi:hypothetical protein